MHNSIIREFEGNPGVVARVFNEGGQHNETLDWTRTFWDNYFPRGSILFDEDGSIGDIYEQPQTGLPFGRGFIIDQEGRIDTPYFGHKPQEAVARIYELLGTTNAESPSAGVLSITAFPNPFNPSVKIRVSDPKASIRIHDLRGRLLRTLEKGQDVWDGRDERGRNVSSGLYLCLAREGSRQARKKLLLLK